MATKKPAKKKKLFTVAQANAALPLVRAIVTDITHLTQELQEREDRLRRLVPKDRAVIDDAHGEELMHVRAEQDRGEERMREYVQELSNLGVELKDYRSGLIDFPCWMDDHEVYLCWRLGEPEVAHWHELDSGFAGRRKLEVNAATN
jgi:hypothetical protein